MARLDFTWVLKVTVEERNLAWAPRVARGLSLGPTVAISWTQLETPEAGKTTPVNQGLGNMQNPHLKSLCGTPTCILYVDRGR